LFSTVSWNDAFEGKNFHAEIYDPLALGLPLDQIEATLRQQRELIRRGVAAMPSHADFVAGIVGPRPS
jgi:hypothetical protein